MVGPTSSGVEFGLNGEKVVLETNIQGDLERNYEGHDENKCNFLSKLL